MLDIAREFVKSQTSADEINSASASPIVNRDSSWYL